MIRYLVFPIFLSSLLFYGSCKKAEIERPDQDPPGQPVKGVPKLITAEVSNLTVYSMVLGGRIIDTMGSRVTEHGIVINTLPNPTFDNNLKRAPVQLTGDSAFSTRVRNLSTATNYYVRAYAINDEGVGYGNEIMVTTPVDNHLGVSEVFLSTQQEVIEFGAKKYTSVNRLVIQGSVNDLKPLSSIIKFTSSLEIRQTTDLINLVGLENVEAIGTTGTEGFNVHHNRRLINFKGLEKVDLIQGNFQVYENDSLRNFEGMDNLSLISALGQFSVGNCPNLQSLKGLEKLRFVDNFFIISSNDKLNDLTALKSLETVYGWLSIVKNNSLTSLNGFVRLKMVDGIDIRNNPLLESLEGISNIDSLNQASVAALVIDGNTKLKNLKGLNKISTADGVQISANPMLTDLQDLANLKEADDGLTVSDNSSLESLNGLQGLRIAGRIIVTNNKSLTNFCSLKPFFMNNAVPFDVIGNAANPSATTILQTCP